MSKQSGSQDIIWAAMGSSWCATPVVRQSAQAGFSNAIAVILHNPSGQWWVARWASRLSRWADQGLGKWVGIDHHTDAADAKFHAPTTAPVSPAPLSGRYQPIALTEISGDETHNSKDHRQNKTGRLILGARVDELSDNPARKPIRSAPRRSLKILLTILN
jgi:hypothetical protein